MWSHSALLEFSEAIGFITRVKVDECMNNTAFAVNGYWANNENAGNERTL